ncbi:MAG: hypothetical protein ABJP48_03820 [Erythrobacter sp.]
MALTEQTREEERQRLAQMALDLVQQRGTEIPLSGLVAESGLSRARFGEIFDDEDDVFDAITGLWFAPHVKAMEEALNADLPPNRKMYEFFCRRFVISRERYLADPAYFGAICEMGAAQFERVRSYVDLADHYLCEVIAEAQAEGFFAGLEIDETLSLINQMVNNYTMPDTLLYLNERLSEQKLAQIIDTIFLGLSGEAGASAGGVNTIRIAASSS